MTELQTTKLIANVTESFEAAGLTIKAKHTLKLANGKRLRIHVCAVEPRTGCVTVLTRGLQTRQYLPLELA